MKDFAKQFYYLLDKLKTNEHFSFGRFSDGELFMMQNKKLVLAQTTGVIGDKVLKQGYAEEDHKNFDPNEHSFYREKLLEAYKFKKHNYFVGLCCKCCQGQTNFDWMVNERGGDDEFLTWANLWVNANYARFMEDFVPELKNKKCVMVVNEKSTLEGLSFPVVKDFRVGANCIINDYNIIDKMKNWIKENNIKDHVFLFSASTLSNFLAHQLFEFCDENTYIDIGTTLNKQLNLTISREYLLEYYNGGRYNCGLSKTCVW